MNKSELRQRLKKSRQSRPIDDVIAKSQVIAENFTRAVDWSKIRTMHIYQAVPDWKEVDTSLVVEKARQKSPNLQIEYASLDKNAPLPAERFDLIVVPVLGFDIDNYRIGLGGGWYDRFLATQPQALKIGLAFQNAFLEDGLPRDPHDIRLDKVITEA